MYKKLEIKGIIEISTGLHIGGSSAFAAIGAVDSPIIRDTITDRPMIPGSSLKGKIRTLLAREYDTDLRTIPENDVPVILRIFGSSKKAKNEDRIPQSRFIFRDTVLSEKEMDKLRKIGINSATEVKFENSINRLTAVANPRQIERVIRGVEFDLNIVYNLEDESEAEQDIQMLAEGFKMLEYDYLGGSGSRGYGKVKFKDLKVEPVVGEIEEELLENCRKALAEV